MAGIETEQPPGLAACTDFTQEHQPTKNRSVGHGTFKK